MKISYNWLKDYLKFDLSVQETSVILTDIGLEVEGIEEVETIKGGLKGIVVGEVLTCEPHPNSDHLNITTVNIGNNEPEKIVCGASNVAKGQKVVVATVGTILYDNDKEFKIKKSKIRGEESNGMICAEDEIGLGNSHDGIMVLPQEAKPGTKASEYFNVKSDFVFEIGLTPNRIDAASHIGTARDLAAYLSMKTPTKYTKPSVDAFKVDNKKNKIKLTIEDTDGCYRYSSTTIEGITIKESPEWLKNKLTAIDINPINNVVDITNFILHETGQPLHAFDADKITGNQVIVKSLPNGTKFKTLDGIERELTEKDLMICNQEEPMCMAGIFGGIDSGITEQTTSVFLESAWFNPVRIRKSARYHGLNTDASFHFERGTDPNNTVYALKRAALLIKELAGGEITSEIIDIYTNPQEPFEIEFDINKFYTTIGKKIDKELIITILKSLEIEVQDNGETLSLKVPPYRVDVKRQADINEEILRIYGYNNIDISTTMHSSIVNKPKPDAEEIQNRISDMLSASGFNETMSNSITKAEYFSKFDTFNENQSVMILNPLSNELNAMRQTLLFSSMETISYNINRQNSNIKLYEFGKTYFYNKQDSDKPLKSYSEFKKLAIALCGNKTKESWTEKQQPVSFFTLKQHVNNVLRKLAVQIDKIEQEYFTNDIAREGITYKYNNKEIATLFIVSKKVKQYFNTDVEIHYAEINWEWLINNYKKAKTQFTDIPKFPSVRRDLSLLIDQTVTFEQLKKETLKTEKKLLKSVDLFDVYQGDKIEKGKKSYAMSFILQDETKTLNDKQINKVMDKITKTLQNKFNAQLR